MGFSTSGGFRGLRPGLRQQESANVELMDVELMEIERKLVLPLDAIARSNKVPGETED
jgi:hypothetical protein